MEKFGKTSKISFEPGTKVCPIRANVTAVIDNIIPT